MGRFFVQERFTRDNIIDPDHLIRAGQVIEAEEMQQPDTGVTLGGDLHQSKLYKAPPSAAPSTGGALGTDPGVVLTGIGSFAATAPAPSAAECAFLADKMRRKAPMSAAEVARVKQIAAQFSGQQTAATSTGVVTPGAQARAEVAQLFAQITAHGSFDLAGGGTMRTPTADSIARGLADVARVRRSTDVLDRMRQGHENFWSKVDAA